MRGPNTFITEKVGNLHNGFLIEAACFVHQRWSIVFQSVRVPRGVKQLGDVQEHKFFEVRVVGNALKPIESHPGLSFEIGDVREVMLGGGLKFTFDVEDVVELSPGLLMSLLLEQGMAQLETAFISTGQNSKSQGPVSSNASMALP